jgi:very-short-patch-repair endonuclease/predicted alpha/beta hydrolase family esterase
MRSTPQIVVDAQGQATSYLSAGAGAPVVLLHGIGGGAGSWEQQLSSVGSGEHRVFEPLSLRERGRGEGTTSASRKLPQIESLLANAKSLRQTSTDAESHLWFFLRDRGFNNHKFRRQHPIETDTGEFILDFYCHELQLNVELDGGQHNEASARSKDERRASALASRGVATVRYWNDDVLVNTEAVLEDLWAVCESRGRSLTPAPLPEGEGFQTSRRSENFENQPALPLIEIMRILAWDAPGYGQSSPISAAQNGSALAYSERMWSWLDALNITEPISLVGQSLGCIMAAAAASLQPTRVAQLTLLAPALGYGNATPQVRESKRDERIKNVEALGMPGMAEKRASAMLAPNASAGKIQSVRETMAAIPAAGYIAATHLLADSDLKTLLANLNNPITIAAGRSDTITPYAQCKAFASEMKSLFVTLGDAGHASPTDEPALVNALIASSLPLQPSPQPSPPGRGGNL